MNIALTRITHYLYFPNKSHWEESFVFDFHNRSLTENPLLTTRVKMLNHLLTCRHWTKPWRKTPTMPNGSANVPTLTHCSKTINVSLHLSFRGRQYVASSTIIKPIASFILYWTTITQWFRSNMNVYGIILSGIVSRSVCRSSVSDISIIILFFVFFLPE